MTRQLPNYCTCLCATSTQRAHQQAPGSTLEAREPPRKVWNASRRVKSPHYCALAACRCLHHAETVPFAGARCCALRRRAHPPHSYYLTPFTSPPLSRRLKICNFTPVSRANHIRGSMVGSPRLDAEDCKQSPRAVRLGFDVFMLQYRVLQGPCRASRVCRARLCSCSCCGPLSGPEPQHTQLLSMANSCAQHCRARPPVDMHRALVPSVSSRPARWGVWCMRKCMRACARARLHACICVQPLGHRAY